MKKNTKVTSLALAGFLTMSTLIGCGSAATEDKEAGTVAETVEQGTTKEEVPVAVAEAEPVTLRFAWWGNDTRHEKTLKVIEMYQKEHPNVTIEPEYRGKSEREKVATELGSGTSADIVQLNQPWMGDFTMNGDFFVDLSQYGFDVDGFDQKMIQDYCIYNDKLITLPSGLNARCFIANKTQLEQMGIECGMDKAWTWDDLITVGKTVHEQNPDKYFLNVDKVEMTEFVLRPYIVQKTGNFLISDNFEIGFTKEDLVDGLTYVSSLYTDGVAVPASEGNTFLNATWTNPDWINGNLISTLSWTSLMSGVIGDSQDEFTTIALPVHADAKDTAIVVKPSQLYGIVNTCEHPEVAADFLNYLLTNEDAGLELGDTRGVPPYKAVQDACMEAGVLSEAMIVATQYAQANAGLYENTASTNAEIITVLNDAVEVVSYDSSQVEAAADQALTLIEDILSTLK